MTDIITPFPTKPRLVRSDNLRPSELFSDMPRMPREERVRRRIEIQGRLDLLEELFNAEIKAIRNLIALDD